MGARSLLRSSLSALALIAATALSALALIAATAAFPSASHAITFTGPGSIIGAELPGLVLACGCLLALARRRRRTA
jgi:hypothetical protein